MQNIFLIRLPEKPQTARDAAHTTDLLSKDSSRTDAVKKVLQILTDISNSCRIDFVDDMGYEAIKAGTLAETHVVVGYATTRMNNVHDMCCLPSSSIISLSPSEQSILG